MAILIDTLSASNLIQQIFLNGDLYSLGAGFGFDTESSIDVNTEFDDSAFSVNVLGVYRNEVYNVTYTGDTSNFTIDGGIDWTASGSFGDLSLNSNGAASYNEFDTTFLYDSSTIVSTMSGNTVYQASQDLSILLSVDQQGSQTNIITEETSGDVTTTGIATNTFIPELNIETDTTFPTNILIKQSDYISDLNRNTVVRVTGNTQIPCESPCSGVFEVSTIQVPEPSYHLGFLLLATLGVVSIIKRKLNSF